MAEQPGEPVPAASKLMEYDSDGEDGATTAEIKARTQNADRSACASSSGKWPRRRASETPRRTCRPSRGAGW